MRSLTGGSAGLPDAFGQIGSRFGKSCSVPGEPLLAYLLGECAPKAIAAKFGCEKYHKRSENIGDNARGEGAVAWVDPTACPTEIQQKRTCLRIPAQSRISSFLYFSVVNELCVNSTLVVEFTFASLNVRASIPHPPLFFFCFCRSR